MILTAIVIGDILVCAFLSGLVAWLYMTPDKKKLDEVAKLPLEED